MSRDQVASVRLTAAEKAQLDAMGGITAVVRERLAAPFRRELPTPITTFAPGYHRVLTGVGFDSYGGVVWSDGTVGGHWPPPATGLS